MTAFGVLRAPRQVIFGAGMRRSAGAATAPLGSRALVCTDARLAADEQFRAIIASLHESGVQTFVFDGGIADLPRDLVHQCVDAARSFEPDVVIGVGGGSCLDLAKVAALVLSHGGRAEHYYGELAVPGPVMPVVAIPTTAGTGSEATPVAVLSDPDRIMKVGISSPHLIPHTAICDPELTYSCPPALTASAGADALSHAIESFTAVRRAASPATAHERVFVGKNELADHHALRAVTLLGRSLRRAHTDSGDTAARQEMLLGAFHAGCALGTAGTAVAHAIQYPVGALTHTPHGVGVGLLLPYAMQFNRPFRVRELAQVAGALGVSAPDNDEEGHADAAIRAVADLMSDIGIPATLRDLGLREDKLRWTAEQALQAQRLVANNPRPLDVDTLEHIIRAAFHGDFGPIHDLSADPGVSHDEERSI